MTRRSGLAQFRHPARHVASVAVPHTIWSPHGDTFVTVRPNHPCHAW